MHSEQHPTLKFDLQELTTYLGEVQRRLPPRDQPVTIVDLINYEGGDVFAKPSPQKNWSTWVQIPKWQRSRPGWAFIDRELDATIIDLEKCRQMEMLHHSLYKAPTNAAFGYGAHVLETLQKHGLYTTHSWLACFVPDRGYIRHYHAALHDYFRVVHIPIVTDGKNRIRFFDDGDAEGARPIEERHFSAGDCFMLNGSVVHDSINQGTEERWHLCSIVYDLNNNFAIGRNGKEYLERHLNQAEIWKRYVLHKEGERFLEWK